MARSLSFVINIIHSSKDVGQIHEYDLSKNIARLKCFTFALLQTSTFFLNYEIWKDIFDADTWTFTGYFFLPQDPYKESHYRLISVVSVLSLWRCASRSTGDHINAFGSTGVSNCKRTSISRLHMCLHSLVAVVCVITQEKDAEFLCFKKCVVWLCKSWACFIDT